MSSWHDAPRSPPPQDKGQTKPKWVFIGFLALAAFYLLAEHRAHLLGLLPWLLLLACPLMHLFMHHGHRPHGGGHGHDRRHADAAEKRDV